MRTGFDVVSVVRVLAFLYQTCRFNRSRWLQGECTWSDILSRGFYVRSRWVPFAIDKSNQTLEYPSEGLESFICYGFGARFREEHGGE